MGQPAMTKMVSATEFKANCLRLIDEIQRTGETVTITRHGKVVAEMSPKGELKERKSLIGLMKGTVTWAPGFDPTAPVMHDDWEEEWNANWDKLGFPAIDPQK